MGEMDWPLSQHDCKNMFTGHIIEKYYLGPESFKIQLASTVSLQFLCAAPPHLPGQLNFHACEIIFRSQWSP